MQVKFYEQANDALLEFAVIVSRSEGKWVFCKHRERSTYECPGGRREEQETILQTARRELYEETGAISFSLEPVCVYSVIGKTRVNESGKETYGMLYYAEIQSFEPELHNEIEKIVLLDELPKECAWTYPQIQPLLLAKVRERIPQVP